MKKSFIIVLLTLRWPNLLLTGLSLVSTYYLLLIPINLSIGNTLFLETNEFILLTTSTLLIMAGGYVINDWMDVESDLRNNKNTDLQIIPRKMLIGYYLILSLVGLSLAFYLAMELGRIEMWTVHLLAFILLLIYSTNLKSTPLAGNILIAILCGLIPLLPLMFNDPSQVFSLNGKFLVIHFLSFFAFLTNLIREMVKDMEDEIGDRHSNLATFPVVFGMEAAKWTCFVFYLLFLVMMCAMLYLQFRKDLYSFIYLFLTIFVPMIYLSYKLRKSQSKTEFHSQSTSIKYVMFAGIAYSIVYYFSSI